MTRTDMRETELDTLPKTRRGSEDSELLSPGRSKVFSADEEHDGAELEAPVTMPTQKRTRSSKETFYREMAFQTIPMILLSLVSSVFTGELVAHLKSWPIFIKVPELFILVPILLNLKGNIEMNLAARFSTSANIGELDIRLTRKTLIIGNLALLQVQALLVSLLAGLIAFLLGFTSRLSSVPNDVVPDTFTEQRGTYFECILVLAASMIAASLSSALVGSFMCALVVLSRKFRINPDNFATPLAASLGDLISLALLGLVASALGRYEAGFLSTVIMIGMLACVAFNVWITMRNAYVQELLWSGWTLLIVAMLISSGTGLVLAQWVNTFKGYGLLQTVVPAVIGNVGAILVSRISTSLHSTTYATSPHMLAAVTLFMLSTPILCVFLVFAVATGQIDFSFFFSILYALVCALGMMAALAFGWVLTVGLWRAKLDPDVNALPLLSSLSDVLGSLLLTVAFTLAGMGKPDALDPDAYDAVPLASSASMPASVSSSAPSAPLIKRTMAAAARTFAKRRISRHL